MPMVLAGDEVELVKTCLRRCADEAEKQMSGMNNCAYFAWWATKLCKARIDRLLKRIEEETK